MLIRALGQDTKLPIAQDDISGEKAGTPFAGLEGKRLKCLSSRIYQSEMRVGALSIERYREKILSSQSWEPRCKPSRAQNQARVGLHGQKERASPLQANCPNARFRIRHVQDSTGAKPVVLTTHLLGRNVIWSVNGDRLHTLHRARHQQTVHGRIHGYADIPVRSIQLPGNPSYRLPMPRSGNDELRGTARLGAVEEEQLPASRFGSFGIGGIKRWLVSGAGPRGLTSRFLVRP